jgi:hypothetical protein
LLDGNTDALALMHDASTLSRTRTRSMRALTWLGDGPDLDAFQADARQLSARPVQWLA